MLQSHRHEAGRGVITDRFPFGAHTDLLEREELLELHVSMLDAGDLGDADDTPHTTTESGLLHDHVDGGPDRLADGPRRQVLPACKTRVSRRTRASCGLLACSVDIEPSWPVFMA